MNSPVGHRRIKGGAGPLQFCVRAATTRASQAVIAPGGTAFRFWVNVFPGGGHQTVLFQPGKNGIQGPAFQCGFPAEVEAVVFTVEVVVENV